MHTATYLLGVLVSFIQFICENICICLFTYISICFVFFMKVVLYRNIWYLYFWNWFISLSIMVSDWDYFVAYGNSVMVSGWDHILQMLEFLSFSWLCSICSILCPFLFQQTSELFPCIYCRLCCYKYRVESCFLICQFHFISVNFQEWDGWVR